LLFTPLVTIIVGLLVLMSTKKVAITRILVAQLYGNIFR
jgi:hypothetical protein